MMPSDEKGASELPACPAKAVPMPRAAAATEEYSTSTSPRERTTREITAPSLPEGMRRNRSFSPLPPSLSRYSSPSVSKRV